MKEIGNADRQEVGRWASNWVKNSHLPFRPGGASTNIFNVVFDAHDIFPGASA